MVLSAEVSQEEYLQWQEENQRVDSTIAEKR